MLPGAPSAARLRLAAALESTCPALSQFLPEILPADPGLEPEEPPIVAAGGPRMSHLGGKPLGRHGEDLLRPPLHSTRQGRGSSGWPCSQVLWCLVCPLGLLCPPHKRDYCYGEQVRLVGVGSQCVGGGLHNQGVGGERRTALH